MSHDEAYPFFASIGVFSHSGYIIQRKLRLWGCGGCEDLAR